MTSRKKEILSYYQADSNTDSRLLALVERMEIAAAALAMGKQGIPPRPCNEDPAIQIVAATVREGFDKGNEAGYQTKGRDHRQMTR